MKHDLWRFKLEFFQDLDSMNQGETTKNHLGNFRPFEWYSQINPRWQSYVHYIFEGLLETFPNFLKDIFFCNYLQLISIIWETFFLIPTDIDGFSLFIKTLSLILTEGLCPLLLRVLYPFPLIYHLNALGHFFSVLSSLKEYIPN